MHMLVENATFAMEGTRAMNCMHECLWKTLSQDCPHGEIRHTRIQIDIGPIAQSLYVYLLLK